jgi:glycine reductase
MGFELGRIEVRELRLGAETSVESGRLTVDADALREQLEAADARLGSVRVHVARPGESTRIACVKDAIEPRTKLRGERIGEGRRHALAGTAVVTCGRIVGFQEGLIDMSGPGAQHTPFSSLNLLVLEVDPVDGIAPHDHEEALREAGLRAAAFVGRAAAEVEPDRIETLVNDPPSPALPRVVYVYMLLSQGLLHDTWVEGRNARDELPRIVEPAFVLDDGLVSGNCVSACDKNTTWHHQNNPVIRELLRRRGEELEFAGIVLTNEPTRLADKQASADRAVALARELRPTGAVISKEGFGNPDADLMMLLRGLEASGIPSVAITDEYAGVSGTSQSLADTTPEADAVVSVGNANEQIELPPMERVLGPTDAVVRLAGAHADSRQPDGGLVVELQVIVGATNQLGQGRLRCEDV